MDLHAIVSDLPIIQGFAERRARIEAGRAEHAHQRMLVISQAQQKQEAYQRAKLEAIDAGKPIPPPPDPVEVPENADGDFYRALAAVDDEQRMYVAGIAPELEAAARKHEATQLNKAVSVPPLEWGPILDDLGLLCRTTRWVRNEVAMRIAGGTVEHAHSNGDGKVTAQITQITNTEAGRRMDGTRQHVTEIDLITAWKTRVSLLDPVVADQPRVVITKDAPRTREEMAARVNAMVQPKPAPPPPRPLRRVG